MPNIELKRPDPNAAAAPGRVPINRPNSAEVANGVIRGLMQTISEQGDAKRRFGYSLQNLGAAVAKFGGTIGGLKGEEAQHIMREATRIDAISYGLASADAMRRAQELLKKEGPFDTPEAAAERLNQFYEREMVGVNTHFFSSEANTRAPGQYFRYAKELGITPESLSIKRISGAIAENQGRQLLAQWAQEQDAINMSIQKTGIAKGISGNITDKDYYKNILSSGYLSESALDAAADSCVNDAIHHKIGTSVADYRQSSNDNYAANVTANEVLTQASFLNTESATGLATAKTDLANAKSALDSATEYAAAEYMRTGNVSEETEKDIAAKQKAYDDAEQKLFDTEDNMMEAELAMALLPECVRQENAIEQTNKDTLEGMRQLFHSEEAEKWRNDPRFPQNKQWADQTEAQALADMANNIELSEAAYTKSLWDNFLKARQDGTSPMQWNTELINATAALGNNMTARELRDFIYELQDIGVELRLSATGAQNIEDVPLQDLTKGMNINESDIKYAIRRFDENGNSLIWEGTKQDLYNDAVSQIQSMDFTQPESRRKLLYTLKASHLLNQEQQKAIGSVAIQALSKPRAKWHGEQHIRESILAAMAQRGMISERYGSVSNPWANCVKKKDKEFAQSLFRLLQDIGRPADPGAFIDAQIGLYLNGQINAATSDALAARTLGLRGLHNARVPDEERVAERREWYRNEAEKARNEEIQLRLKDAAPYTMQERRRLMNMSAEEYNNMLKERGARINKTLSRWTPMRDVAEAIRYFPFGFLEVNSGIGAIFDGSSQAKKRSDELKEAQRNNSAQQKRHKELQQRAAKAQNEADTYGR